MEQIKEFLTSDFVLSSQLWVYLVIGLCALAVIVIAVVMVVKVGNLRKENAFIRKSLNESCNELLNELTNLREINAKKTDDYNELLKESKIQISFLTLRKEHLQNELKIIKSEYREKAMKDSISVIDTLDMATAKEFDVVKMADKILTFYLGKHKQH